MLGNDTKNDHDARERLIVVTGPTAAGKTDLSLELARAVDAEIINGDAMQSYQGLEIGTAKPTETERGGVPHHLFDLWRVDETASLAHYQRTARAVAQQVWAGGRQVIVVGGSPLYLRALCDELDIPPRDPALRAELTERAEREGGAALHRELAQLDPQAAAEIDPRNVRRVVRALEVVRLTGSFTARIPDPTSWRPTVWLGVDLPRDVLDERIKQRAERMWQAGLLRETADLSVSGLREGATAKKAVGYQQALAVLAGDATEEEWLADTVRATSRLARRQQRTLRRDRRIHWLDGTLAPDQLLAAALPLVTSRRGGPV